MKIKFSKILIPMLIVLSFQISAYAEEIKMEVHGMACSFCAYGLEKKIKKIKGVESISVDVTTGIALLKTKDGVTIDPALIQKAVKDSGLKLHHTEIIQADLLMKEGDHQVQGGSASASGEMHHEG